MREHLLGYLMGALDASQQQQVEEALAHDPQLRRELDLLDQALNPLRADRGLYEPPTGLADRTLDVVAAVAGWPDEVEQPGAVHDAGLVDSAEDIFVAERALDDEHALISSKSASASPGRRGSGAFAPAAETGIRSWADRWALLDLAVSVAVMAAAAMLFFPAIAHSRFQSRLTACQANLQTIGRGLEKYSENNHGEFVQIPVEGNLSIGGVYAPTLRDEGYVEDESTFFCAGDLSSRQNEAKRAHATIPKISELERAVDTELRRLQRLAGGSFGYNLGYMVEGKYSPVRNLRRSNFAVMADAPGPQGAGRVSMNHEGRGQNVLFEDGHVEFVNDSLVAGFDEFYFSDRGLVEAGLHPDDAVIGNSHSRPMLRITPVSDRSSAP